MMKKLTAILLLLILCLALMLPASASTYAEDTLLLDRIDLFSEQEEADIVSRIVHFIEKRNCHMMILTDTIVYNNDYMITDVLDTLRSEDLVILTISLSHGTYYYNLFTYGNAYQQLSDSDVDAILDADKVYNNIKGGNVYDGVLAFIDMTEARMGAFSFKAEMLPGTLILALIVALICCGTVVARYKMKAKPTNYPLDRFTRLELTEQNDIFTGSFVTKRRISSSSSSGGRSGGGGGGRSGGHRGGR